MRAYVGRIIRISSAINNQLIRTCLQVDRVYRQNQTI